MCLCLGPFLGGINLSRVPHPQPADKDISDGQVMRSMKMSASHCYRIHECSHTYHNMDMQQEKWRTIGSLNSTRKEVRLGVMFLFLL